MNNSQTTVPANIAILPASPEQAPVVANLLELYAHDFSEFVKLELDANGRFGYEALSLYWQEPSRHPFLITVDGHWAGFAFVLRGSQISVGGLPKELQGRYPRRLAGGLR